nr:P2b [Dichorhavirus orchidaceae]
MPGLGDILSALSYICFSLSVMHMIIEMLNSDSPDAIIYVLGIMQYVVVIHAFK